MVRRDKDEKHGGKEGSGVGYIYKMRKWRKGRDEGWICNGCDSLPLGADITTGNDKRFVGIKSRMRL